MEGKVMKFPSMLGALTQRQLYAVLTDPTLFEIKKSISVIQEPLLIEIESRTSRQYLELQAAMLKLPL
jgi:hypothetical protein